MSRRKPRCGSCWMRSADRWVPTTVMPPIGAEPTHDVLGKPGVLRCPDCAPGLGVALVLLAEPWAGAA